MKPTPQMKESARLAKKHKGWFILGAASALIVVACASPNAQEVFATMNVWEIFGYVCAGLYVVVASWLLVSDICEETRRGRR